MGTPQDIMGRLRAAVAGADGRQAPAGGENWQPAVIEFLHHNDAVAPAGAPEAERLLGASLARRGLCAKAMLTPFCCDLRHFVNRADTPGLVFGPGEIREAHRPNESIALRQYLDAIEILIEFIAGWSGTPRSAPR
jgi:acetylornithine deacetylase